MWFLTCVFPGAGDPPEQVATGFEAGRVRPRPVRRFPLLLHHDRVQRLHVCQPPHVYGGVEHSGMPRIWKPQGFHSEPPVFLFYNNTDLSADCSSPPPLHSLLCNPFVPNMNPISLRGSKAVRMDAILRCLLVTQCRSSMPIVWGIACYCSKVFSSLCAPAIFLPI